MIQFLDPIQHLYAVHVRQLDIEQNDIKKALFQDMDCFLPIWRSAHLVGHLFQDFR